SCTHDTMAVIYHDSLECLVCRRRPPQGFLYRCTVDREPLILDAASRGYSAAFDKCGMAFAGEMTLGKFGADARSNPHNLFNELTPEQLASYTPEQLAILVSQRENVSPRLRGRFIAETLVLMSFPDDDEDDDKPWVPDWRFECQYRVCHRCRPDSRQKSWLSLDAVLNGDILPTVATGFSFSLQGFRPCGDVNVVKTLGCRAIPLV
ncbi:uncharacterized protein THITE_2012147, partial [Thermothielavioides terrestris NRRL 8126]